LKEVKQWTAAGKAILKEKPDHLTLPMSFSRARFEEALKRYGFKDEESAALIQSFYRPEEHIAGNSP